LQFELVEKELELGLWLGITRKDYGATITDGQINVDHLHGAELLKHCTGSESGSQVSQTPPQSDIKSSGVSRKARAVIRCSSANCGWNGNPNASLLNWISYLMLIKRT
jgi:hypothetical protein